LFLSGSNVAGCVLGVSRPRTGWFQRIAVRRKVVPELSKPVKIHRGR